VLEGKVRSATFVSDNRLAIQDSENNLRLWDVSGMKPKMEASIRMPRPSRIAFSADGGRMATGTEYEVQLWEQQGANYVPMSGISAKSGGSGNFGPFILTPDGTTLITGQSSGAVRFWSVAEKSLTEQDPLPPQPYAHHGHGIGPVLIPPGNLVASAAEDERVRIWRIDGTVPREVAFPDDEPRKGDPLATTRDGRMLLTLDKTVQLWHVDGTNVRESEMLKTLKLSAQRGTLSPDGTVLALSFDDKISLWNLTGDIARETDKLTLGNGIIHFLTFDPAGRSLFASVADGKMRRWSVADGKLTESVELPFDGGLPLAIAPDGKTVAALTLDRLHFQFLAEGKTPIPLLDTGRAWSVAFSPDGQSVVTAGHRLIVWELATSRPLHQWTLPGPVQWATYAPDGRHLLTANSNGTIYVLRLAPSPDPKYFRP